jgi:hypothetical protein
VWARPTPQRSAVYQLLAPLAILDTSAAPIDQEIPHRLVPFHEEIRVLERGPMVLHVGAALVLTEISISRLILY